MQHGMIYLKFLFKYHLIFLLHILVRKKKLQRNNISAKTGLVHAMQGDGPHPSLHKYHVSPWANGEESAMMRTSGY